MQFAILHFLAYVCRMSTAVTRSPSPSENKLEAKARVPYWKLKDVKDREISDFSMFDNDEKPFMYICSRFVYKNKAQIQKDKEMEAAMADYNERSRNLSVFDVIQPPQISENVGGVIPLPITDELRLFLTPLCNLALDNYNVAAENQDTKFVLTHIVKTTWGVGGMYYVTFLATTAVDLSNDNPTAATTFQATVHKMGSQPPKVFSCAAVKTN